MKSLKKINVSKDFILWDDHLSRYNLAVDEDFTYIYYQELAEDQITYENKDAMTIDADFAYQIAKIIVEEYEKMKEE